MNSIRNIIFLGMVVMGIIMALVVFEKPKPPQAPPVESSTESNIAPTYSEAPSDISKIPILTYHSFGPKPAFKENKTQLQYRVTVAMFESHMKYLADKGYATITFADLVENQISGKPLPKNPVVITFDDGWKSQYEFAVPILEKYKFTATFFIITNSIGAKAYMTVDELKDLHTKGFEIASHTKSHPKLPSLDDVKLVEELQGSKKDLEGRVGITVKTLAYPYYAYDDRVMKAVQDAGYLGARAGWGSFKNGSDRLFEMVSQESVNNPNPFASTRVAE